MSKYSFELVLDMRERIFEGYETFEEYKMIPTNERPKMPKAKFAKKAWNRAKLTVNSEAEWQKFILEDASEKFKAFQNSLDTYYNEGFGTFKLDEVLNISKASIVEMLPWKLPN